MTENHHLLYRLTELMLKYEQHILPVDLLFDDEQIGDFVKSIQIDSPYQQMLLEGVLTESVLDENLYVSFTIEGYFHYVLGEVIYNQTEGKDANDLKKLVEENKLKGAKEGVEQCLIRDVQKDVLKRLMLLIDEGGAILDICSVPLASAFLMAKNELDTAKIFKSLFLSQTDYDISVLIKAINYLEDLQKHTIVLNLYKLINKKIVPVTPNKASLYLNSIQYSDKRIRIKQLNKLDKKFLNGTLKIIDNDFNYDYAIQFYIVGQYPKSIDILKKLLKKKDLSPTFKSTIYNDLGVNYASLNNLSKSIFYYKKSLKQIHKSDNERNKEGEARTNHSLSTSYFQKGQYKKSLEFSKKSLQIGLSIFGKYHPNSANIFSNLGYLYKTLGDKKSGMEFLKSALDIHKFLGSQMYRQISAINDGLGQIYQDNKENEIAISYYKMSISIIAKNYGVTDYELTVPLNNLALLYEEMHDYTRALSTYKKAFKICVINRGNYDFETLNTLYSLAYCSYLNQSFSSASKYFELLIKNDIEYEILASYNDLYEIIAECYQKLNDIENAILFYLKNCEFKRVLNGIEDKSTIIAANKFIKYSNSNSHSFQIPEWVNNFYNDI